MRASLRLTSLAGLVLALSAAACAGDTPTDKDGSVAAEGLTDGTRLGAADAYGPYRGDIAWDAAVSASLDAYTWYHLWSIEVAETSTATIDLTGDLDGDTYLMLYEYTDRGWVRIARNDDCHGATLDSCLDAELGAGEYLVLVSTYDALAWRVFPDTDYSLQVGCKGGACADTLCGSDGRSDVPTDFVSADDGSGPYLGIPVHRLTETAVDLEADESEERTVEEGDIYRVLGDGLILNLNTYRGLQVIDVSNPAEPAIIGRSAVSGTPVELYAVGDTAYVLLNDWQGYYGRGESTRVASFRGGLLLAVDLSDPNNPVVTAEQTVRGSIRTSRLTRQGDRVAVYVVADETVPPENETGALVQWTSRTVVSSFAASDGQLSPSGTLDLGGHVAAVQATPEALLVARNNWREERFSRVALVDISDPDGALVEGGEVEVAGLVQRKTNLDLSDGILRVVSGSTWRGTTANHLETFDARNLANPTPVDHCEFGEGQSLFATLFLDDRAFFVTYLRVDPFHAFALDADGSCEERSEFIVSGWNDYFRPVARGERLIGIGTNDEEGRRTMAVSLYDITDLDSAEPLVARAEVEADRSWSEASWDDRAFSVLENAVAVGTDETTETGLVLLPFTGYRQDRGEYVSAVQIFTFSDTTLTRRGLMEHDTQVRRSFLADSDTTANLSDTELRLHDHVRPDSPQELGRLPLAPNYTDLVIFGDYGVRLERTSDAYAGWWGDRAELPPAVAQIIDLRDDPDAARPVAEIQIPANATLDRVGHLLVVVDRQRTDHEGATLTRIEVFDLADPTAPRYAGVTETERLAAAASYFRPMIACFRGPCLPPIGLNDLERHAVGDALVFLERRSRDEVIGHERSCSIQPVQPRCDEREGACLSYRGMVHCASLDDAEPVCSGEIRACEPGDEGACRVVDPETIETTENCWDYDRSRYWQSLSAHVLDLSEPSAPAFAAPVVLPIDDEAVSALADERQLWLTVKRPATVEGDGRAHARYFVRSLDVSAPASPILGDPINVPGEPVIADGVDLITRDRVWGENGLETRVARAIVCEGRAYEQAGQRFADHDVQAIVGDGRDHILVSHRLSWQVAHELGVINPTQQLSLLDDATLERTGDVEIDDWASLRTAQAGRALFEVPGGLLVVNTELGWLPYAQAYFPVRGWPRELHLLGDRFLFAAGRFGIYELGLDEYNLR